MNGSVYFIALTARSSVHIQFQFQLHLTAANTSRMQLKRSQFEREMNICKYDDDEITLNEPHYQSIRN